MRDTKVTFGLRDEFLKVATLETYVPLLNSVGFQKVTPKSTTPRIRIYVFLCILYDYLKKRLGCRLSSSCLHELVLTRLKEFPSFIGEFRLCSGKLMPISKMFFVFVCYLN